MLGLQRQVLVKPLLSEFLLCRWRKPIKCLEQKKKQKYWTLDWFVCNYFLYIFYLQGILNDRKKDEERKLNKDISEAEPEDFDDEPPEEELLLDEQIETVETMENEDEEAEKDLVAGKLKGDKLRALILTPTRELAIQIKNHIQVLLLLLLFKIM